MYGQIKSNQIHCFKPCSPLRGRLSATQPPCAQFNAMLKGQTGQLHQPERSTTITRGCRTRSTPMTTPITRGTPNTRSTTMPHHRCLRTSLFLPCSGHRRSQALSCCAQLQCLQFNAMLRAPCRPQLLYRSFQPRAMGCRRLRLDLATLAHRQPRTSINCHRARNTCHAPRLSATSPVHEPRGPEQGVLCALP